MKVKGAKKVGKVFGIIRDDTFGIEIASLDGYFLKRERVIPHVKNDLGFFLEAKGVNQKGMGALGGEYLGRFSFAHFFQYVEDGESFYLLYALPRPVFLGLRGG